MMLMLLIGGVLELMVFLVARFLKPYPAFAIIPIAAIGFWFGYSLSDINWFMVALGIIALFRMLNLFKFAKNNIHKNYLLNVTGRTSYVLLIATATVVLVEMLSINIPQNQAITILAFSQLVVALFILAVTARNLQKTHHHTSKHFYSDKELPTVTVAIPARNETNDLASCLRTILANDYPKLEILVLDDCSHDRTAEIIKDFAHDGVRFIKGDPPEDRWLAKNQAYQTLANHASGQVILFCGVDVRFGPQAIRSLVSSMLTKKRSMMSVLPFRIGGGVNTSLIQPLRYWWELALPRRLFNRPPVLSTCWLIEKKFMKKRGYFKGVSHNILPERYFAKEAVKTDEYAFIRADEHLDVKTVKPVEEQLKTAIRVKYPSLRKRPENILLLLIFEICFLFAPFLLAFSWLWSDPNTAHVLALLASVFLVVTHYLIMSASHPLHSMVALINFPFAITTEMLITLISMYKYEFGKVEWKGRNVCIPAMHVVRKLPRI